MAEESGMPSRFVEFITPNDHLCGVNSKRVCSVRKIDDGSPENRSICEISLENGYIMLVLGEYVDVCAKLGIPTEGSVA